MVRAGDIQKYGCSQLRMGSAWWIMTPPSELYHFIHTTIHKNY